MAKLVYPTTRVTVGKLDHGDMFLSEQGPMFVVSQNASITVCKYADNRQQVINNHEIVDHVQPVQMKYKVKNIDGMLLNLVSYDGKREISVHMLDNESDYDLITYYFQQKHEIAVFVTSYLDEIFYYEYFQLE